MLMGLVLSGLIGWLAYRRGSLTKSGVAGAVVVGTAIFGLGGWAWGLTLLTFFVTSTLLSHYRESTKEQLGEKFAKGHRRDLGQALANGGVGGLIAALYAIRPDPLLLAAFAGAMATVNADTWATELGVLAKTPPRLITTWRPAEVGTSGAVSMPGVMASLGGAMAVAIALVGSLSLEAIFVAGAPVAGGPYAVSVLSLAAAAVVAGLVGSVFDSCLGATAQAMYYCPACQKETEKTLHACGRSTHWTRGWKWLGNDMVNFVASLVGALVAAVLYSVCIDSTSS